MHEVDLRTAGPRRRVVRRAGNRVGFERLERRELLSSYSVTNTLDDGSNGSLPWAIAQVNQDTTDTTFSPNVIDFSIGSGGAQTIALSSALPQITNPVVIDGASQSAQSGYSGPPLATIDGSSLSSSSSPAILSVADGSSTIEGLAIVGGPGAGIVLTGAGENLVQGCYIGTPDGTSAEGNNAGIQVNDSRE